MSEKKQSTLKEKYSLDAIAVNQKVRVRKTREDRDKYLCEILGRIEDTYFKDVNDFMFDDASEDITAIRISQEKGNDRT